MTVDLKDGACRACGGQLRITNCNGTTMTVLCTSPDCSESYDIEVDSFRDDTMKYAFPFVMERRCGREAS